MSTTIRKTTLLGSSFFILAILCSCAKTYSDQNSVYYPSAQPYQFSDSGMYGYGQESYAVTDGERWGPICPIDGSDLSYMQTSQDIAISMPVVDMPGAAGMAPCIPPSHVKSVGGAPMMANGHQYSQPMSAPYQNHMYSNSGPVSNNSVGGALPVSGVIGGANQEGYLFLDCSGTYVNKNSNCGRRGQGDHNAGGMPSGHGSLMGGQQHVNPSYMTNTMQNDSGHGNAGDKVARGASGASGDWVASEGVSLRVLLEEWGDRAGWKVVWNSDREYIVEAGAVFKGQFMDVSSALIRAFARANPAPQGTFYKGNKVLVINTQEAENAE